MYLIEIFILDKRVLHISARSFHLYKGGQAYYFALIGPVAQRLEQWTHNPLVVGSNPTGPTETPCKSLIYKGFLFWGICGG